MGYNIEGIRIGLRLDNHLGPQTKLDKQAAEHLQQDIDKLVDANPAYKRIVYDVGRGT